ncbi:hypothetical protein M9458_010007, partial [Cirrhinus mrigala]
FIHVSQDVMSWEKALDYCSSQVNTSGLLRIESEDDQTETERELKRQKISGPPTFRILDLEQQAPSGTLDQLERRKRTGTSDIRALR